MVKVGVVLSGCGYLDGAEIYESTATLLALDRAGAEVVCMAPDVEQRDVIDHRTGKTIPGERRNVLMEASRVARGQIEDIANVQMGELDAIIFPGGFGAAKNLCNFAEAGEDAQIHPEVARLVRDAAQSKKPIGAICIAPALIAAAFRGQNNRPRLTIGNDQSTASKLAAMGADHECKEVREVCVDRQNLIVSTPAYMLAGRISETFDGIESLVKELMNLIPK